MSKHRPISEIELAALSGLLKRLAKRVRKTPPYTFELTEQNAIEEAPDNYMYREVRDGGPLETRVTIRWQP